jgi:hypothetical protein
MHKTNGQGVSFPCFLFANEVTTLNNESWISMHGYVLENWQWILVLLNLERIINYCWGYLECDVETLLVQNGLTKVKIGKKLVSKLEQMVDLCLLVADLKIQCIWKRI